MYTYVYIYVCVYIYIYIYIYIYSQELLGVVRGRSDRGGGRYQPGAYEPPERLKARKNNTNKQLSGRWMQSGGWVATWLDSRVVGQRGVRP